MTRDDQYVIRGGVEGRERLRVLARVLHPTTSSLLDRLSLRPGMSCLDVGCGGGDVTVELARRVGPTGHVLGIDVDETTLEVAREEAKEQGIGNVEFTTADIRAQRHLPEFDLVYARFLLTHLEAPEGVIEVLRDLVRPEGVLAAEDIDFSGAYTYPESDAYRRYHELYVNVVRRRGGDPNIGRRLPVLLLDGGVEDVQLSVVQPMAISGEAKLLDSLTMRNIADTVVRDGLAPTAEVDSIVDELHRFANDPGTIAGLPRIVQAWGRCPRRRPLVADQHHTGPGRVIRDSVIGYEEGDESLTSVGRAIRQRRPADNALRDDRIEFRVADVAPSPRDRSGPGRDRGHHRPLREGDQRREPRRIGGDLLT